MTLSQHLAALKAALESCVYSMENELQYGGKQSLTIRNAERVLAELAADEVHMNVEIPWIEVQPPVLIEDFKESRVGVQVQLSSGQILLIEDISSNLGGCDCCGYHGSYVTRWRELILPKVESNVTKVS